MTAPVPNYFEKVCGKQSPHPRHAREAYGAHYVCPGVADTESTAALARVTQERDYLLGVVEGMRRTIAELIAERDEALAMLHGSIPSSKEHQ